MSTGFFNTMTRAMLAIGAMTFCAIPVCAGAVAYPTRPVTVVVPFFPGGAVDSIARIVSAKLQEYWKQPVMVENLAGGGGNIGSNSVAQAPPDGYRLLFAPHGTVSYNVALYKSMPYDPATAFAPITLVGRSPNFLIVARDSKFNSLSDIVEAARKQPGALTYASQGIGTTPHLTGALLARAANIDITHVPYRGFPPAVTDLISGQVSFMFADSGNTASQSEGNKIKILATTAEKRWPAFPDVPTTAELSYPTVISSVWYAVVAPAKTPAGIVGQIRGDIRRAVDDPEVAAKLRQMQVDVVVTTPSEASRILKSETARWSDVIRAIGLAPQ